MDFQGNYKATFNWVFTPANPQGNWTPGQITTALWLDALDSDSITYDGDGVSQWDDKSGNNNNATQSNNTYKPEYNTVTDSIDFDLSRMNFTLTAARAGIAVVRNANGYRYSSTVTPIVGHSTLYNCVFLRTNSSDYTVSIDGDGNQQGDVSINGGSLFPDNLTGTNINVTDDGYTGFPTHNEPDVAYWQFDDTGTYSVDWLGSFGNTGETKLDIHELILLTYIPSTEVRQKLEGYLANKWDLKDKLPSSHPYKNIAPKI